MGVSSVPVPPQSPWANYRGTERGALTEGSQVGSQVYPKVPSQVLFATPAGGCCKTCPLFR